MRVLSFESRRAKEIAILLRSNGFDPFVAPALREVPIEENVEAFEFGERLLKGEFELLVCLTGVGLRYLIQALATRHDEAKIKASIANLTTVVRGPKPAAAMREMGLTPTLIAREPSTTNEVLELLKNRPERRTAVQEYGRSDVALIAGMREMGMNVTAVPVYQWAFPLNTKPLEEAINKLLDREFDIVMFTTAVQLDHLLKLAEERGIRTQVRDRLSETKIASIGPSTSAALESENLTPFFVPSQTKMGLLVHELAQLIHSV